MISGILSPVPQENKRIVSAFIEAINQQDWERFDQLVAPDFVRRSCTFGQATVRTREQLRKNLMGEFETFPDARETINFMVTEGDRVAVHSHFCATQLGPLGSFPASGKTLSANFISIYRLADERIVEAWIEWDILNSLIQLGHLQPPQIDSSARLTAC